MRAIRLRLAFGSRDRKLKVKADRKEMRERHLKRREAELERKFLKELPEEERHLYVKSIKIFLAVTIKAYLFDELSGEELIQHIIKRIPTLNGYENCAYPHESLEEISRKYAKRVEKKFAKYRHDPLLQ